MGLFTRGRIAAPLLFLATGVFVAAAGTGGRAAAVQKEKKDKEKKDKNAKGSEKAAKDLRKAFDGITDFAQAPVGGKEAARAFDHASRFYREAVKAYPDDPRRAAELAVAAKDAVRGLEHLRRGSARPVAGLPEPPAEFGPPPKGKGPPPPDAGVGADRGPWSDALDALTVARERLTEVDAGFPVTGAARDFLDAARTLYAQARTAYEAGEYRKAAELGRAAEAWSHVPEHLMRAGWDVAGVPSAAPLPKPTGPGAPPPPPAIKD